MVRKRKIIVYIATSADGFIARTDGSVDWLDRPRPKGNYGMGAFYKSIDTVLWGRKTCDMALDFQKKGVPGTAFDTRVKNYVFTRGPLPAAAPAGVEFVSEPIQAFATRLREEKGKDIWMMGGAGIIASFLDEREIDEFMIHVIPKFIGEGIPLIAPGRRTVPLKLISCTKFDAQILFGSRIRSIREAAGLSREVSAEKSEINANYLGEIERGEKWPSLEVIQRLAAALQVSPAAFFEFQGEEVDPSALRATVHKMLRKRETEDLQQAVRVLKALFRI